MMAREKKPGRGSDQYPLRFPDGMREALKYAAAKNGHSLNQEIVSRLEQSLLLSLPMVSPDLAKRIEEAPAEKRARAERTIGNEVWALLNEYFPPPRPEITPHEFAMRVAALITQLTPEQMEEAKAYLSGDWEKLIAEYEIDRKMPF